MKRSEQRILTTHVGSLSDALACGSGREPGDHRGHEHREHLAAPAGVEGQLSLEEGVGRLPRTGVSHTYALTDLRGEEMPPMKPEAILPLDQNADGLRVLLLFDGAKEDGPRSIRVLSVTSSF
jgi:hypothetical protein